MKLLVLISLITACSLPMPFKSTSKEKDYAINVKYDTLMAKNSKDTITFLTSTKLNWNDFKGKPKAELNVAAISNVGFKYDADIAETNNTITINIKVASFFIRSKSWKLNTATDYILEHEQLHFDIARVAADLFIKNIRRRKMNIDNFDTQLAAAYNEAWSEFSTLQRNYDSESNHSINKAQQEQWHTKVKAMLAEALEHN